MIKTKDVKKSYANKERSVGLKVDLRKYVDARNELAGRYQRLIEIAESMEHERLANDVRTSYNLLREDGFKVVVVGEFSRGKSTFINALLGQKVLPAKTNPTTTTINRIVYGDSPRYLLHFRQQEDIQEISEEKFKSIVAIEASGDDEEAQQVYQQALQELGNIAYTELRYPLELTRGGVELIDTPGTNDLDQAREEITLRFIPQADAAVMLLSAEQILARSEMDFLRERILKSDICKIFFVVNFKDRLTDPVDGERILNLAREQLQGLVAQPRLFLVSARGALNWRRAMGGEVFKGKVPETFEETGFPNLEQVLADYLVEERASTKLLKYEQRLTRYAQCCKDEAVTLRRRCLGVEVRELEQELTLLRPKLERARQRSHQVFDNLRSRLQLETGSLTSEYQRGLKNISIQVQKTMHSYNGPLDVEAVAHGLEAVTAPLQQEHDRYMNQKVQECLTKAFISVQQKLKEIFKTEQLSSRHELVAIDEHNDLPMSLDINAIDMSEVEIMGGGMLIGGLILAMNAPFIAIPAAFFGGKYLMQRFEAYKMADFRTKVSSQLRSRYDEIIPLQADQFRKKLQGQFQSLCESVEEMIDHQLVSQRQRLEAVLQEKNVAQRNDDVERGRLDELDRELAGLTRT